MIGRTLSLAIQSAFGFGTLMALAMSAIYSACGIELPSQVLVGFFACTAIPVAFIIWALPNGA